MDPIDRNDPYPPQIVSNMDSIARNDPYSPVSGPLVPVAHDAFHYMRLAGSFLGVMVVLAGLYFAALSFGIVRDILESPQRLNGYLDEWYIPPKETVASAPAREPENVATPEAATIPAPAAEASPADTQKHREPSAPTSVEAKKDGQAEPESLAKLRSATTNRKATPNKTEDEPFMQAIQLLTDALTRGGLPRLAGALIILLLVSMLIRIPFGLIKAGTEIVRAMVPERRRQAP